MNTLEIVEQQDGGISLLILAEADDHGRYQVGWVEIRTHIGNGTAIQVEVGRNDEALTGPVEVIVR